MTREPILERLLAYCVWEYHSGELVVPDSEAAYASRLDVQIHEQDGKLRVIVTDRLGAEPDDAS